jgi:hypothetical protein
MAEATDDTTTDLAPGSDAAILAELTERYDYAMTQKAAIVEAGDTDVAFNAGRTWNAEDKAARTGRPILELDQLSQYTNQLVNSYRQNPRGIKVSPGGGGATDQTATYYANRVRQIEYDSHAQEVYTVAGENGATRGYGYARIVPEHDADGNQVLRLKAIPNPNQVVEDPDAESTSGADWNYLFFVHTITTREFRRTYPDATITDFSPATTAGLHKSWFGKVGRLQIAEYWTVTETPPPSGKGKPTRTVSMYLTNGVEILQKPGFPKKTEWKGSSIPFMACYGQIVYQTTESGEAEKDLQAYTRKARDGAKGYNWTASTELEALALPVKAALMGYKGQADADTLLLIERAAREPIAWIEFAAAMDATGQSVLPLPQYGTRSPDIQGYEIARESFRRDIQNALGHFSASDARQGATKVTSGIALQELNKSGDLGSYHHTAHYDDMIREAGVKLVELLPFYDDTDKEVPTRQADGTTKLVRVNRMTGRDPQGNAAYGPDDLHLDPAQRHTVTISTGPSRDSQRAEGKDAAMTLLGNPQFAPVIASDAVRLMDLGALGDQMAEDLEYLQPPAMQQARQQKKDGGKGPDPRQLAQENAQLKQQVQHAEGVMQQQHTELQGKQAELASKEKIAQLEIDSKERMAALDREAKIAVAELGAKVDRQALFLEERGRIGAHLQDAATQASDQLHEHQQSELARVAAAEAATQAQAHQAGMAAAGAGAAADAQDAGHQQTLAVGQQAADLAPPPDAPAE